jgi:hypothetical protein
MRKHVANCLDSVSIPVRTVFQIDLRAKCVSFEKFCELFCKRNNFFYVPVPADGSCQYSAVLVGLDHLGKNEHEYDVSDLRAAVGNYALIKYEERSELMINILQFDDDSGELCIQEFVAKVKDMTVETGRVWGGDGTLKLMADLFDVQIVVSSLLSVSISGLIKRSNSLTFHPTNEELLEQRPRVFLIYDGQSHYAAAVAE